MGGYDIPLNFSHCFAQRWFPLAHLLELWNPNEMERSPPPASLPPHLVEVCDLLARALVRLSRRAKENGASETAALIESREISLHFTAAQSSHAKRNHRRQA